MALMPETGPPSRRGCQPRGPGGPMTGCRVTMSVHQPQVHSRGPSRAAAPRLKVLPETKTRVLQGHNFQKCWQW